MSEQYNPNKHGWFAAGVTVVVTLGLLFTSYRIHTNTYRNPRDPMNQQVYHERDLAAKAAAPHEAAGVTHEAAPGVAH